MGPQGTALSSSKSPTARWCGSPLPWRGSKPFGGLRARPYPQKLLVDPLGLTSSHAKPTKLSIVANSQQHGAVQLGEVLVGYQDGLVVALVLGHMSGGAHYVAHGLDHQIVDGALGLGSVLAKAPHPALCESIGMAVEVAHGSDTDLPPGRK